jgi:hypothetical protein
LSGKLNIEAKMKKILAIIALLTISMSFLTGCSDSTVNSLTFKNGASYKVSINFRGSEINIPANNGKMEIKDVKRGTYTYETTFEYPQTATTVKTEGAVSGQVSLKAGTKVLIVFSSSTSIDGSTYTLNATISSSDDIFGGDDDNPIVP